MINEEKLKEFLELYSYLHVGQKGELFEKRLNEIFEEEPKK